MQKIPAYVDLDALLWTKEPAIRSALGATEWAVLLGLSIDWLAAEGLLF
jgi:hypothetical protein